MYSIYLVANIYNNFTPSITHNSYNISVSIKYLITKPEANPLQIYRINMLELELICLCFLSHPVYFPDFLY